MNRRAGLTLLVLLAPVASARAFEIPGVELVYTQPAETSLRNADLRPAKRVWLELFRSARRSIDIEQMYAVSKAGEPLEGVIDALEEASLRGVHIRFVLEKKMLRASDAFTIERLRKIENLDLQLLEFRRALGRESIIHAKFIVVDGKRGYLGSQNFDWRSLKHVHETGVKIDDEKIAGQMQAIFNIDYAAARRIAADPPAASKGAGHFEKDAPAEIEAPDATAQSAGAEPESADAVRLVASPPELLPPGVGWSQRALVKLLNGAKKEIRAQVMNYAPTDHGGPYRVIDNALRAAAGRGVKVKLMVADWSTKRPAIDYLKKLSQVPNVEVRVVSLPVSSEGYIPFARVIHSKTCTVDGQTAWVGTSNWEGGYLNRLRNLELIVEDQRFAERLGKLHDQLWTSEYAEPIDVNKDYVPPRHGE